MRKVLYASALGIIGAGIVHIVILLLLPAYSEQAAWTGDSSAASNIPLPLENSEGGAASSNPFIKAAACRFDLADSALHVQAPETAIPFWSMAVYDGKGLNQFSLNNRTTNRATLDFLLVNPSQTQRLKAGIPAAFAQSHFVETKSEEGIAVVRAFVPDTTWSGLADSFFAGLRCEPAHLD